MWSFWILKLIKFFLCSAEPCDFQKPNIFNAHKFFFPTSFAFGSISIFMEPFFESFDTFN